MCVADERFDFVEMKVYTESVTWELASLQSTIDKKFNPKKILLF